MVITSMERKHRKEMGNVIGRVFFVIQLLNHVQVFATLWTVAHQVSLSIGILQARILEWVEISFSRGSSWPGIKPRSPVLADRFFTIEPPRKPCWERGTHNMWEAESLCWEFRQQGRMDDPQLLTTVSINPHNTMLSKRSKAIRSVFCRIPLIQSTKTGRVTCDIKVRLAVIAEVEECLGDTEGILFMVHFLIQVLLTLVCSVSQNSSDWTFVIVCLFYTNITW